MFCSKCGKTLKDGAVQCPFCLSPVGETRFNGMQYTSGQSAILPGQFKSAGDTSAPAADENAEGRTAYRVPEETAEFTQEQMDGMREALRTGVMEEPRQSDAPVSEEVLETAREKMRRIDEGLGEEDITIDRSQLEIRPIEVHGQAGVSSEVQEYIREMRENADKKKNRAEARKERRMREALEELVDDEGEEGADAAEGAEDLGDDEVIRPASRFADRLKRRKRRADEAPEAAPAEEEAAQGAAEGEEYPAQKGGKLSGLLSRFAGRRKSRAAEDDEVYGDEGYEEEGGAEGAPDEGEAPAPQVQPPAQDAPQEEAVDIPLEGAQEDVPVYGEDDEDEGEYFDAPRFTPKKILLLLGALLVVAALFVGGFLLFRGGGSEKTVPGVTPTLYSEGIRALRENASESSIAGYLDVFRSEGYMSLNMKLNAQEKAFTSLIPENPQENDRAFCDALVFIQGNIASNVIMDANGNNPTSSQTWQMIRSSIDALENAKSAEDIAKVLNGTKVVEHAPEPTVQPGPSPTPVVYQTLSKGDKGENVLKLQTRLYDLGFFTDKRDSDFGTKTQTAVKLFQQAAGLSVSGIADNETLTLLYSDKAPSTNGLTGVTPAPGTGN